MLRSTRLLHLSVKASYFAKKRNHHNSDFFIYANLHRQRNRKGCAFLFVLGGFNCSAVFGYNPGCDGKA